MHKKNGAIVYKTINGRLSQKVVGHINSVITAGGIMVFPTDTVYGIGCSPFSYSSVKRIYAIKKRSFRKQLILLGGTFSQVRPFIEFSHEELGIQRLLSRFCPGPLTLVFKTSELGKMITGGKDTVGVRIPGKCVFTSLLAQMGIPMLTTSANLSNQVNTVDGSTAKKIFCNKVDIIIDNGRIKKGIASTVIDVTAYPYTVIREGCIPKGMVYEVSKNS